MDFFSKNSNVVKIGVWGPPGSGKSTYLTMLQYADCQGWKIRPRGDQTIELYLEYGEIIRDHLKFIPQTIPNEVSYLTFDFEEPKGFIRNRQYRVILPEASGEHYERPETRPELMQEMSRYQGIIWLVDPERIDNPPPRGRGYRRMIQEWLNRLYEMHGGNTLPQYMAFCLTKMDLPGHSEYINNPEYYCLEKLGKDVALFLDNFCDPAKVEFFATSSIGFKDDTMESTIDLEDRSKLRYPAEPVNLFTPFLWLFNSIR